MANILTRLRRFLSAATSAGISTASTGNPYIIAGSAAAAGTLNAARSDAEFDPAPHRAALARLRAASERRLARQEGAVGQAVGQNLAARGLGQSALAEGIVQGSRRAATSAERDRLDEIEASVELGIADQQAADQFARANELNTDLTSIGVQGVDFVNRLFEPAPANTALGRLQEKLGLENIKPVDITNLLTRGRNQINIGAGISVDRNSVLGRLFGNSQTFVESLGEQYAGGPEGLFDLLGDLK